MSNRTPMSNKVLIFSGAVVFALVAVFFIPRRIERFALDPVPFFSGEYWRLLTYSLVHLDGWHLAGNVLSFAVLALLAYELRVSMLSYSSVYSLVSVLGVLPVWLVVQFTALGASVVVYAVAGFVIPRLREFGVRVHYVFAGIIIVIFSRFFILDVDRGITLQAISHATGLFAGISLFFLAQFFLSRTEKRRNNCLRAAYEG